MHRLGLRRYLIAGILVFLPLWLTYVIVKFIFTILAGVSEPLLRGVLDWPQWALLAVSAILTLLLIYLLGWLASWVFGKRLIHLFDRLLERVPLVQTIYGGARKLLSVLQTSPDQSQRVVLVERPDDGVKMVGLVTRFLTDTTTGEDYAAVYLPSTPNPTAGTLELVSLDYVHPSHMSMDEAMSFIVSGGTVSPARFVEKTDPPAVETDPALDKT
jgi:uncharacterized membrane protein